jgi:hypothetical protein
LLSPWDFITFTGKGRKGRYRLTGARRKKLLYASQTLIIEPIGDHMIEWHKVEKLTARHTVMLDLIAAVKEVVKEVNLG